MAEWLIAAVSKIASRLSGTGVQIPPSPLYKLLKHKVAMQKVFKHYKLFSNYPWINPDSHVTPPYLVIGDDLDALLSAALWNTVSDRDWKIIGVYHKYEKIVTATRYHRDLGNAIWLDLDINSYTIKSIGHHLIFPDSSAKLTSNHLNLNYLGKISCKNFRKKYPLGTIHFLMYLFDNDIPECKFAREMILSADSTWINGQKHRFRKNVKRWIYNCIPIRGFKSCQKLLDTLEFEKSMKAYFNHLESNNIPRGTGQVKSNLLKLSGYQFQFDPSKESELKHRFDLIESITGWDPPQTISFNTEIIGNRKRTYLSQIKSFDIHKIMDGQDIFSYVFPHKGVINYTTGIDLNSK